MTLFLFMDATEVRAVAVSVLLVVCLQRQHSHVPPATSAAITHKSGIIHEVTPQFREVTATRVSSVTTSDVLLGHA